jgi:ABC-type multidrug transport system permease subunit
VIAYVGAAATKSIAILGLIILATAALFVPLRIEHPVWMVLFLVLTAVTFSLFGFIIGIWADGFEKLQLVPLLIVTPLTFLGGSFYSIEHAAAVLADGRRCSIPSSTWSAASAGASSASRTSASGSASA